MRLTKVEILRESIKIIIGALSEKSVPITQVGSRAFVEWHPVTGVPKRINIPYVPDNASDRLIKAVQGFVDHECAHVLFTDFNCVKLAVKSGAGMVGNILEDTYIERKMKALYAGSRHNLLEVWGFLAEEMLKEPLDAAIAEGHRAKIVATGLPIAIHAWAGNEAAVDFMATRWDAFKDIKEIIGNDIIDEIPNVKSSHDGLLLAVAMKNRLVEWKEKEEREEKARREKERDKKREEEKEKSEGGGDSSDPDMDDVIDSDRDGEEDGESDSPIGDDDSEDSIEGDDDCDPGEGGGDDDDYDEDDEDFRPPDPRSEEDEDFEDDSETEAGSGDDDEGDEPEEGTAEDFESTFDPDTHNPEDDDTKSDDELGVTPPTEEGDEEDDGGGKDGEASDGKDPDDSPVEDEGEGEKLMDTDEHGTESPEGPPPESREEEEKEEEEIDMSDFESEAEEILEAMKDLEDMEGVSNKMISEEMDKALETTDYWPLTKDADVIERYTPDRVDTMFVRHRQEEISKHIGHITKRLQRMIQAKSYDRRIPGFRSGKLDGAALHRVPTGDDRVFRRVHKMTTKDVDVQLVVDLSGSMTGDKVELATEVAYAVGLPLDRLGINNQIVGFTTLDMTSITHHQKIIEDKHEGRAPSRFEPIYMPILKDWNQSFTPDRQTAVIMSARDVNLWNNIDGESIEYAGRMLWAQKGARKLMIVLSDGSPSAHGNRKEQAVHLRRVIRRLEAAGTEIFGIGIMDENVSRFYKNAVIIHRLEDVLSTVMGVLENMLMRGAL